MNCKPVPKAEKNAVRVLTAICWNAIVLSQYTDTGKQHARQYDPKRVMSPKNFERQQAK